MKKGIIYGVLAYFLWGVFPIYWKLLQDVRAPEILMHRIVWSFGFVLVIMALRNNWEWLRLLYRNPRQGAIFLISAVLLSVNWLTFIWAVNHNFIVEASLGYFINPLFSVLLGVLFLKERLRMGQVLAILLAVAGVVYLTVNYGRFPWIALTLVFTFGTYGLLRKIAPLGSLEGLGIETAVLCIPALAVIVYFEHIGAAAFLHSGLLTTLLLVGAGAVTATPLLLFSAAARRITLTAVGLLQYIAPTLQFIIGVAVYGEPFSRVRFIGFCFIWVALAIYTAEGLYQTHRHRLYR